MQLKLVVTFGVFEQNKQLPLPFNTRLPYAHKRKRLLLQVGEHLSTRGVGNLEGRTQRLGRISDVAPPDTEIFV